MFFLKNISIKIGDIISNFFSNKNVYFVTENADWVIKDISYNIKKYLKDKISIKVSLSHFGIKNSIIHFGSVNTFIVNEKKIRTPHKSNKIVLSWFHVVRDDNRKKCIKKIKNRVELWHTSCNLTKNKLVKLGVPENKIIIIPIGTDLKHFCPINNLEKKRLREKFGIKDDYFVVGSFQKDGNGWAEGNDPKLIKGPDIFCDVVEKINKEKKVFVVLTGPSRGYVKNRLNKAKIPFLHSFLKNPQDVSTFYNLLDLYIVSSRVEGGPKAIAESMASGVPIVSTKVGMAPDYIVDGENGMLCDIEDVDNLVKKALLVSKNKKIRDWLIKNGLKTAKNLDMKKIARRYYDEIYKKLI